MADCLFERGTIYQQARDYRSACAELKQAVKLNPKNHQVGV